MEKIPQNKNFENKYDNAELQTDRTAKDIAAGYIDIGEMQAYKLYLETLKLEGEVAASNVSVESRVVKPDGSYDTKNIDIKDLVPAQSHFEQARRRVLVKLNDIQNSNGGAAKLKQLLSNFETDSIFELSSKITNYLNDKASRDSVATQFKLY
jgi:hypothetical protein